MGLVDRKCEPCEDGMKPLERDVAARLLNEIGSWTIQGDSFLRKEWTFPDFAQALSFTNRVGALAEAEGHHPDIYLTWGKVKLEITTHDVGGLTENDFILAAKCDAL